MIDIFLDNLMAKLNTVITNFKVYYEKAPDNAVYPYGVVPDLSISNLSYGYQCLFDVEVYINELSTSNVEALCDSLRTSLDGYNYQNSIVGFHISFENQYLGKMTEQDSSMRRVSFIARIF